MQAEKTPRERAEDLISLLVPDWRPTAQQVLWAIRIAVVLSSAVAIGYYYDVTLWDWIKLLIVPAVIVGGGLWFNRQQRERELEIARAQREREVEISERRTQDEALQAYLDQMGQLLLNGLREAKVGNEKRTLAQARTLTVLARLDDDRKRSVGQFLYQARLIGWIDPLEDFDGQEGGPTKTR
jgi:hypothetical protein